MVGQSTSQYLPYSEFKWLIRKEIDRFDVNSISKNSSDGHMLEVDLECPVELHYLHSDYPLAPEKLEISNDMSSSYCSNIANKCGIKVDDVTKLIPDIGNKSKYVDRYKNLQLYLSLRKKLIFKF